MCLKKSKLYSTDEVGLSKVSKISKKKMRIFSVIDAHLSSHR